MNRSEQVYIFNASTSANILVLAHQIISPVFHSPHQKPYSCRIAGRFAPQQAFYDARASTDDPCTREAQARLVRNGTPP
jgi:hypothetical protein